MFESCHPDQHPIKMSENYKADWPFALSQEEVTPRVKKDTVKAVVENTSGLRKSEAKARAEAAARNRQRLKDDLQRIMKDYSLEFMHFGDTTVAWRTGIQSPNGRNHGKIVEVSTSICHKKDNFTKWVGSALAAQNFEKGAIIRLRVPKGYVSAGEFVRATFGNLTLSVDEMCDKIEDLVDTLKSEYL